MDWCGTGPFTGYWVPPQCEADPTSCVLMVHVIPGYDTGYLEQNIRNLGLKVIVGYFGFTTHNRIVTEMQAKGKDVLFYYWGPDPFMKLVDGRRVSFPDYFGGCADGNNQD